MNTIIAIVVILGISIMAFCWELHLKELDKRERDRQRRFE